MSDGDKFKWNRRYSVFGWQTVNWDMHCLSVCVCVCACVCECVLVCVCVWVRVSLRAIMHVREHKPSKKRGGKERERGRGRGDRRGSCFLAPLWCNRVRATWGRSMIFCLDSTYLERELATLWLDSGGRIQVKECERESVCVLHRVLLCTQSCYKRPISLFSLCFGEREKSSLVTLEEHHKKVPLNSLNASNSSDGSPTPSSPLVVVDALKVSDKEKKMRESKTFRTPDDDPSNR